jgi:hypothetical protein
MAINWEKHLAFMLERIQKLEEGIQVTDGYKWKFCPADVIDRLQKLENMVFHKPSHNSMMIMKTNLKNRILMIRDQVNQIDALLEKLCDEIHE